MGESAGAGVVELLEFGGSGVEDVGEGGSFPAFALEPRAFGVVGGSDLEPEVGLEPTTYRLQGDCSVYTMASTCSNGCVINPTGRLGYHR